MKASASQALLEIIQPSEADAETAPAPQVPTGSPFAITQTVTAFGYAPDVNASEAQPIQPFTESKLTRKVSA